APINSGCETMREEWAALGRYEEFYRPQKGDLVFFDKDEDGLADSVGIVSRMKTGSFIAIEGNVEDSVQETVYTFGDPAIMGFGLLPAEEEEIGFGAMMLLSSGTPLSFANWINGVSLKYQRYGTGAWNDLQTGASVTPDDNLRFNINYTVPPNMLSEGNDTIYYDIPDVIRLVAGNSGSVKSQTGATMGNYVVLPTGRIEITFNEDNVAQNAGGHQITGFIAFDCAVSDIDGIEDGQTQVSIGGVTVNIPVEEEQHTPSGLNVDKRYTIVDPINGIVEFTVEVENSVKVEAPFVIEDHMNGDLRYYDGLQIKTPNGNDVTASFTIEDITNNPAVSGVSSSTKDFKLTKNSSVAADGKYIVTYRAKLANPYNGDLRVTNRATASGKDVDG
ncbi:MAG: hypothetical protein HUJ80_06800, partial [Firmicutes bacterium]|nr:hypothetical protein [Bacillota bacterium]